MALPDPHFLINFKASDGTAARSGLALLDKIAAVSEQTGVSFVVAPQMADLSLSVQRSDIPIVAQTTDIRENANGRIPLETIAASGAAGVILNHPETEMSLDATVRGINECKAKGIESIVCVNSLEMGRAVLEFEPDWLLFERPDDIASEESLAETAPERLKAFVSMVDTNRPCTRVMVGGGISDGAAVGQALRYGADAAGAASAFMQADNRESWLLDVANAMSDD